MKIINILTFIYIIILYHFTKDNNSLLLTISFSLFLIYYSILSSNKIKELLSYYHSKKYNYTEYKTLKYISLLILIFTSLIGVISYIISIIINIKELFKVLIAMSIFMCIYLIIKLINNYLNILGYKKNILLNIYKITAIILSIILIIISPHIKIIDYQKIIMIYLLPALIGIILIIITYILVLRKKRKNQKKREEVKINYLKDIKKSLIDNKSIIIYNLVSSSYIYIGIIILYYIMLKRYHYDYKDISIYITNTYLYGILLIYYIHIIIKKIYQKDINNINEENIQDKFHKVLNKLINALLTVTIVLLIISGPINNLLFKCDYNFIISLVPLLFIYTIYDFTINLNINITSRKNTIYLLVIGLITSIIFEIPFINSAYRMGYSLESGSVSSIMLGMIISITISIILITKKYKIFLLDNFKNILNIIYENIILCLILVLFTLVVKVDTSSVISSILTIIFYIFITIIYYIIKKIILPKKIK